MASTDGARIATEDRTWFIVGRRQEYLGEGRANLLRVTVSGIGADWVEGTATFDHVIVATHADEALALVENAPDVLSTVRYNPAVAVVHRDPSVLPPDRERWQSWNYGRSGDSTYVVWWMNKLQSLKTENDYFLTLDCPLPLENVVAEIPYTHPVISVEVRELQQRIYDINERGRIKYCGSYFHSPALGPDLIASHEAAHSSGVEAASAVKRALPAFEGDRSGSPAVTS